MLTGDPVAFGILEHLSFVVETQSWVYTKFFTEILWAFNSIIGFTALWDVIKFFILQLSNFPRKEWLFFIALMRTIDWFFDTLSKYINHISIKVILLTKFSGQSKRFITRLRINIYFFTILKLDLQLQKGMICIILLWGVGVAIVLQHLLVELLLFMLGLILIHLLNILYTLIFIIDIAFGITWEGNGIIGVGVYGVGNRKKEVVLLVYLV